MVSLQLKSKKLEVLDLMNLFRLLKSEPSVMTTGKEFLYDKIFFESKGQIRDKFV